MARIDPATGRFAPAPRAATPAALRNYRRLLRAAFRCLDAVCDANSDVGRGSWSEPIAMAVNEVEFTLDDFVMDLVAVAPELAADVPYLVQDAAFTGVPVSDLVPKRLTRAERLARVAERMGRILVHDLPPAAWSRVPPNWLDQPT